MSTPKCHMSTYMHLKCVREDRVRKRELGSSDPFSSGQWVDILGGVRINDSDTTQINKVTAKCHKFHPSAGRKSQLSNSLRLSPGVLQLSPLLAARWNMTLLSNTVNAGKNCGFFNWTSFCSLFSSLFNLHCTFVALCYSLCVNIFSSSVHFFYFFQPLLLLSPTNTCY